MGNQSRSPSLDLDPSLPSQRASLKAPMSPTSRKCLSSPNDSSFFKDHHGVHHKCSGSNCCRGRKTRPVSVSRSSSSDWVQISSKRRKAFGKKAETIDTVLFEGVHAHGGLVNECVGLWDGCQVNWSRCSESGLPGLLSDCQHEESLTAPALMKVSVAAL